MRIVAQTTLLPTFTFAAELFRCSCLSYTDAACVISMSHGIMRRYSKLRSVPHHWQWYWYTNATDHVIGHQLMYGESTGKQFSPRKVAHDIGH